MLKNTGTEGMRNLGAGKAGEFLLTPAVTKLTRVFLLVFIGYEPREKTVSLSPKNYSSTSIFEGLRLIRLSQP